MLIRDHLGRRLVLDLPAQRIISLCPSITETLYSLGAGSNVVGRTRFCIHPQPDVKNALNVGGTKDVNLPRIASLQPDLIVAEKEENTKEIVETLERDYHVFVGDVKTVVDALRLIRDLGKLTGKKDEAATLVRTIQDLLPVGEFLPNYSYAYMIWKNPEMAVGHDTYIDDLLSRFGFQNALSKMPGRYPQVSMEMLEELSPDVVFLASEPYPFSGDDQDFFSDYLPDSTIMPIDGEIAWYGSRMVNAIEVLKEVRMRLQTD